MLQRKFFPSHTHTHITNIGIPYPTSTAIDVALHILYTCMNVFHKDKASRGEKYIKYVSSEYCPPSRHYSIDSNYLVHCVNPMTEPIDPNTPLRSFICHIHRIVSNTTLLAITSPVFFIRAEFPSALPPHIVEHVAKTKQKKRAREK